MTSIDCIRLRGTLGVALLLLTMSSIGCQALRRAIGPKESTAATEQPQTAEDEQAPAAPAEPPAEPVDPPAKPVDPPDAEPESVPEIDEVSIVEEENEPRLLSEDEQVSLRELDGRVERADELSRTLDERELSAELATQVAAGRAFLQDAKDAREAGDLKRVTVLIDKCLVLLEDAEQQTRP